MTVHWDGSELVALEQTLAGVSGRVTPAVAKVIKDGGEAIAKRAKGLAPRRSGKLQRSINSTFTQGGGGSEATAEIGPKAFYGRFVEHGTARMSPHPYLAPAADAESEAITEALAKAATEAVLG